MTFDHAALFGEDYPERDVYAMHGLASGDVWCALSLGGGAVLARKAGETAPNEDALCIAEDGARVLLAVADGHFGPLASHVLIERLDLALQERARDASAASVAGSRVVPPDLGALCRLVAERADTGADSGDSGSADRAQRRSETTLVVAVLDRAAREVWGLSVGDSSAVVLGLASRARWLTRATRSYATPADAASLATERVRTFRAPVSPGEVVAVFSDGVNECNYGRPETSIGLRHMESLFSRVAGHPERFVEGLVQLALAGVDGHPGGEDNVAVAVARG